MWSLKPPFLCPILAYLVYLFAFSILSHLDWLNLTILPYTGFFLSDMYLMTNSETALVSKAR